MEDKVKLDAEKHPEEKIILPDNLQREMIKFFLKTSVPKLAEMSETKREKENQQTSPKSNKAKE